MKTLRWMFASGVLAVLAGLGFVFSGWYPMGADVPHNRLTFWILETLRERSIARSIRDIDVPPLDDPQMLLTGGADYADMCAGCHLKPGQSESDMSIGLYPKPPNLADSGAHEDHEHADAGSRAARQFWTIKHGIKASAMPAWGPTHDDPRIWAMVAFLQKLPSLTPEQYQILTARGAPGELGHTAPPDTGAHADEHAASALTESAAQAPESTVEAFQAALRSGDAEAAAAWLAPDVQIYESGGVERSRDEYRQHHMLADMAFLKTAQVDVIKRDAGQSGDTAWVMSELRMRGKSSKGRDVDVLSGETALLRQTAEGWRIAHLHWSSQDYKPKSGEQ